MIMAFICMVIAFIAFLNDQATLGWCMFGLGVIVWAITRARGE